MASIVVVIKREPFADFFELVLPNGHTEQLDPDEARAWFKERGADMEKTEKAFDYAWNFYESEAEINRYSEPEEKRHPHSPNLPRPAA